MSYNEATSPEVYSEENFDGHNAAPLLLIGAERDDEVLAYQDGIVDSLSRLARTEIAHYAADRVVDFSVGSMMSRIHQREALNAHSYMRRKYIGPRYDLLPHLAPSDIDEACEASRRGKGTAMQNEITRVSLGMDSVEYGNLTIIGEKRKQLEPSLWSGISELIGKSVFMHPENIYRMKVFGFDRDIREPGNVNYGAIRIGIKHHIDDTPYGAIVKGRTTATINTSTSIGISSDMKDLFRETAIKATQGRDEHGRRVDEIEGFKAIADLPEFKSCVTWLMSNDIPEGIVLARNETVYGVQKPTTPVS